MALHGSSIPLDGGGFVTTVVCPNHYSHQRLMLAISNIVPEAGDPPPVACHDNHAHQHSVSTTPAGAQSGGVIDTTRTAYNPVNQRTGD
jgi:hypothetical protein